MPTCAKIVVVNGENMIALDVGNPNLTTCSYVVESGVDVSNNFWTLSATDGAVFSAGVISCWMVAYGIRSIMFIVKGSSNE